VISATSAVDHLVYATGDLDAAVAALERRLHARATAGGQHPGRGTRNALLALGPRTYLEIIGPDPAQPAPAGPRWFGVGAANEGRLVTWAAAHDDLDALAKAARSRELELGPVTAGSRRQPDGSLLHWRLTDPTTLLGDGLVPFFIDWRNSPHPAATAAREVELVELRAEHPAPPRIHAMLAAVGLTMRVDDGPQPVLVATVRTRAGLVELR
jgi:hypothetical protein